MVVVDNLTHRYDDRTILRNISLEVPSGEILAIMGSSGGGKTTLFKCISGLIQPSEGRVTVDGVDVQRDPDEARRRMGMVFQSAALFDYLNVEDNVLFGVKRWMDLPVSEQRSLVANTLDRVGLKGTEKLFPSELSGGMRKRVGIARALALKPKVMLYDEPTTGLDPITTYTIDQLIVQLRDELGMTSLVVSHDVGSVLRIANRVAFLEGGEMTFLGSTAEFQKAERDAIKELIFKSRSETFSQPH